VFFDRDGVLIENRPGYVRDWADVQFFEAAFEACRRLSETEFVTVEVTNQAAVGRGLLTLEHVQSLNQMILERFALEGAPFAAAYICPHHPDAGCTCRKPLPGMLLQAGNELDLDLSRSFLVGDALTDLEAADAAHVKGILVRTGRGIEQESRMSQVDMDRWPVVDDIAEAVKLILAADYLYDEKWWKGS
jgi:D-glycero-D-manno-heptose 1,7-bisphosphate phosphatase